MCKPPVTELFLWPVWMCKPPVAELFLRWMRMCKPPATGAVLVAGAYVYTLSPPPCILNSAGPWWMLL
jgi:hypothetical protein